MIKLLSHTTFCEILLQLCTIDRSRLRYPVLDRRSLRLSSVHQIFECKCRQVPEVKVRKGRLLVQCGQPRKRNHVVGGPALHPSLPSLASNPNIGPQHTYSRCSCPSVLSIFLSIAVTVCYDASLPAHYYCKLLRTFGDDVGGEKVLPSPCQPKNNKSDSALRKVNKTMSPNAMCTQQHAFSSNGRRHLDAALSSNGSNDMPSIGRS